LEYLAQHKEKTEFQKVTRKKNELPITAKGKEGKRAGRQGSQAK
jgi:hypothetical protein